MNKYELQQIFPDDIRQAIGRFPSIAEAEKHAKKIGKRGEWYQVAFVASQLIVTPQAFTEEAPAQ